MIVKHKKDYEKELKILEDRTHHDSKRKKHLPMKPKQGFLAIVVVFSNVYFSLTVNMSFQLSIYQIIFLNLKNLFITLFVHRQILIHLHHWDHNKEKASSNIYSNAPAYYILLNFLTPPPCLLRFPFFGTLE